VSIIQDRGVVLRGVFLSSLERLRKVPSLCLGQVTVLCILQAMQKSLTLSSFCNCVEILRHSASLAVYNNTTASALKNSSTSSRLLPSTLRVHALLSEVTNLQSLLFHHAQRNLSRNKVLFLSHLQKMEYIFLLPMT
jgi:hypothetical protein